MKKFELLAASAIILLSATPALAQTDPTPPQDAAATTTEGAAQDQAPDQSGGVPDIIITAQRQSQRLQDVPIAVSAFTAQNLEQQQIVNPSALQQSIPNVSFTKTNFTGSSFTIRGIGDLCTGTTCDTATGIAVNDMPLVSTRLFESEFYDLERIEVLRGPQGTLFGRNATSGVVNFITAKPDFSGIHADGEFEYGNFDSKKAKAMFNLPIGNTLAVRVAGLWLKRDGFTKNDYDDSRIDGRNLYSVRGTLSWQPDSDTRLDLIGYYFHEKDDRDRIQKQLCHRDPTGILGCLPDRLDNQETNWNSTLGALLSSQEFFRVATYQPVYEGAYAAALGAGASQAMAAAAAAAAAGSTSSLYSSLGLGSIYGADALAGASNPADLRTVNLDYNPTYYAQEKQLQAKFFHDFGSLSLNLTGGYAENKVDSRTDYSNSVEAPLTGNTGLATLYGYSQAPGAAFPGGVNPFAPIAQVLEPNGPAGTFCQSDINGNDGGVYSGASIGCYAQSLDPDRSVAKYSQWSAEGHIDSHFDGMFNFLLGGIYLDQKITNNEYEISNFGIDYASGILGSVPAFLGAGPAGVIAATPFYNNDEARYRLKSYGIFGETYFDFTDKLKLTLGLRYNHDHKFLSARTTLLQDSNGEVPYLPYGSTNLSDALNYAGLDYDANVAGLQPYSEDTVSFSRLTGRAVIDYKISRNNLLYASYSRGYKSGGINPPLSPSFAVPTTFRPEKVDSFELGSKNTFLNGTLQLNLTGFYYKYKDLQLARIVSRTAVNDNIDADIYGIEAEAVISPINDFVVNANFSYLHSKVTSSDELPDTRDPSGGRSDAVIIKDLTGGANCAVVSAAGSSAAAQQFVNGTNAAIGTAVGDAGLFQPAVQVLPNGTFGAYSVCSQLTGAAAAYGGAFTVYDTGIPVSLKGNSLPQAPTYKFAIGAQYTIHTGGDTSLVPRVDLNYTGNSYASIFNDTIDRMQGYEVVNAQIQFNGPDDRWYIRGFVKNLTDDNAITGQYVTDQSTGLFTNVFTIEPRQYGAAVGFKF
ncbi:TonB-dependent receptor [Sphingomonas koreensis]|nr:TonB-dependent receptor [Sphingomonas koreensis]